METTQSRPTPVAPWWHCATLVAAFLAFAALGAAYGRGGGGGGGSAARSPRAAVYLSLVALEWGLVLFVAKGVRRGGTSLGAVVGGRWRAPRDVVRDVTIAAALWCAWLVVAAAWDRWLGPTPARGVRPLLPRGAVEVALWVALSASAGFAEELVFRGYLQRQLHALTGSPWAALLGQAALFGVAHGYQGAAACARIAAYGALFGAAALWRASLRPGMVAHAWTDVAAGVLRG